MADGFVLPFEAAATGEPQMIPGVPGLWIPGEAVHPATLGMTHDEVAAAIDELDLPLIAGSVDAPAVDFLDRTGGMVSGAEEGSDSAGPRLEPSGVPGLNAEEVVERDAYDERMKEIDAAVPEGPQEGSPEAGFDPSDYMTVAEPAAPGPVELDDLTVAQLRDLADEHDVDLAGASTKSEIVTVLEGAGVEPGGEV